MDIPTREPISAGESAGWVPRAIKKSTWQFFSTANRFIAEKAAGIGALRVASGMMTSVLPPEERAGAIPFETRVSISEVDSAFGDNGLSLAFRLTDFDNYTGQK